jgi:adenine-specific DNA-methyltransferase
MFPESKRTFNTAPKPLELVSDLIGFASSDGDIIMDSFAGSGTTAHAVLSINARIGGNRRFIAVEMVPEVAETITAQRLNRAISGYAKKGKAENPIEPLGGGFRFCRLGTPLFDEFGDIAQEVEFSDLAAHIFFSETGVPIPHRATSEYLGTHQGRAVYLLFDATNAQTPREAAGNVLTLDRLAALPAPPEGFEGLRVVYAEGCTVSADRLKAQGVVFKQIPYQVEGS